MATCPKCQLPNPDAAEACIWCGQHRFEPGAAPVVASVSAPTEGEQADAIPGPSVAIPVIVPPQIASPLVASFVTPTTPPPGQKPLPSHLGLLFSRAANGTGNAAPLTSEQTPDKPASTQAGVMILPNPSPPTVTSTPPLQQNLPKLVVLRGLKVNHEYPIYDGRNVIGRFADRPVDIDLIAQEAEGQIWSSRQHAALTFDKNLLLIEDLNSLNGTWVNGTRLYAGQQRTLKPNDVIQIGTVQLKVVFS